MGKFKRIVYYSLSGEDSLAVNRLLGPARQNSLTIINGVIDGIPQVEMIHEGDIIIFHRDFCREFTPFEEILSLARSARKLTVLELDDLLFELPSSHPDRKSGYFADALLPMYKALVEVDLVTVASPRLLEFLAPINSNISLFSNYLNDAMWYLRDPQEASGSGDKILIGYMGSHSHTPDLEMVLPALESIIEKYRDRIQLIFWGIEPPSPIKEQSIINWYPPESLMYADFVSFFQRQQADIVIAPLIDTLFNKCKSSIKFLEYSANGFPGVYSNLEPYSNIVEDGHDGFLAATIDEWVKKLCLLIESESLRKRIVDNAQQKIKDNWLLSKNAHKLLDVYNRGTPFIEKPESARQSIDPILTMTVRQVQETLLHQKLDIQKLSQQLQQSEEQSQITEKQLKELRDKIVEKINLLEQMRQENLLLEDQIKYQQEEILSYALSKSWQITRPFRKLMRKR